MNSANQFLQAIKNKKALLKKKRDESIAYIEAHYREDIAALDKEEKEWLEQFDDVPVEDIYESDSKVKKYRKKPIVIEAYRTDKEFDIPTPEGVMKASVGDYIITGVSGEQYPCKPDIFWESYEEVDGL
ncbi:MAG: hypothetical protein J6M08_06160 [Methanobrevibacter sp.]|nr:hypothetical protein [Methanobrevibacter sp.]